MKPDAATARSRRFFSGTAEAAMPWQPPIQEHRGFRRSCRITRHRGAAGELATASRAML
jgi:hypothetical protein